MTTGSPRQLAIAAGMKKYWLPDPCPKGHVGFRSVRRGECCACRRLAGGKNPAKRARHLRPDYKEKRRLKLQRRRARDPMFRVMSNIRRRTARSLDGTAKATSTMELLGCSTEDLRLHLAALFTPGMSWDNYGLGNDKWNLDHKIPLAAFDLTDPEQLAAACHFTNLQPLWQPDNLSKGASQKIPG